MILLPLFRLQSKYLGCYSLLFCFKSFIFTFFCKLHNALDSSMFVLTSTLQLNKAFFQHFPLYLFPSQTQTCTKLHVWATWNFIFLSAVIVHLQVHICMSRGETFPNLHGQLDVTGLAFQIYDAPSLFSVCQSFPFGDLSSSVPSIQYHVVADQDGNIVFLDRTQQSTILSFILREELRSSFQLLQELSCHNVFG